MFLPPPPKILPSPGKKSADAYVNRLTVFNARKKYYRANSWQIENCPDDWYPTQEVDGHWKEPAEKNVI